jgi:hypothetical protein
LTDAVKYCVKLIDKKIVHVHIIFCSAEVTLVLFSFFFKEKSILHYLYAVADYICGFFAHLQNCNFLWICISGLIRLYCIVIAELKRSHNHKYHNYTLIYCSIGSTLFTVIFTVRISVRVPVFFLKGTLTRDFRPLVFFLKINSP